MKSSTKSSMIGTLTHSIRCWAKTTPYDLTPGVAVHATYDSQLEWWVVALDTDNGSVTLTTTDKPKIR